MIQWPQVWKKIPVQNKYLKMDREVLRGLGGGSIQSLSNVLKITTNTKGLFNIGETLSLIDFCPHCPLSARSVFGVIGQSEAILPRLILPEWVNGQHRHSSRDFRWQSWKIFSEIRTHTVLKQSRATHQNQLLKCQNDVLCILVYFLSPTLPFPFFFFYRNNPREKKKEKNFTKDKSGRICGICKNLHLCYLNSSFFIRRWKILLLQFIIFALLPLHKPGEGGGKGGSVFPVISSWFIRS